MTEGFCVKCREKVTMNSPEEKTNVRGVKYLQSTCGKCNSRVNTFVKRT